MCCGIMVSVENEAALGRRIFIATAATASRKEGRPMDVIDTIDKEQMRTDIPDFRPGDSVRVHLKVIEGERERIQVFEGIVIRRRGGGLRETFTVRKVSQGIGVERTFPVHSPRIERIEIVRRGRVRRARLYYLRDRVGKASRIEEKQLH